MRRTILTGLLLLLGGVAAAKGTTNEDMTGQLEHQMANCPSAVPGAKTDVRDQKDGVVVTVTADNPRMRDAIRQRAHVQENIAMQSARGAIEHTGQGTGSGKFGFCPGMIEGTHLAVDDVPDGSQLTVRATSPAEARSLQQMTRARLRELRAKR